MFNGRQLKQEKKNNPLQNPLSLCICHMCMLQILLKNRQKKPQFNKKYVFFKMMMGREKANQIYQTPTLFKSWSNCD